MYNGRYNYITIFYVLLFYSVGESFSTKSPDGRPARLTHKYTATITDLELSRMRQDITNEYRRRDGNTPVLKKISLLTRLDTFLKKS